MASAKTTVVRALVSAFLSAAFLVTPAFAATPVAVWDGDFTATQTGYTLNRNGNALSQDNSTITIDQSVGVTVTKDEGTFASGFTVLVRYSDLNIALTNKQVLATSTLTDATDRTGVSINESGKSCGIWAGASWNTSGTYNSMTSDQSSGVLAFTHYSTTTYSGTGTRLLSLGKYSAAAATIMDAGSLGSDSDKTKYKGFAVGGRSVAADGFSSAAGMKITGIAVFAGILSTSDMLGYRWPSDITIPVSENISVSALTAQLAQASRAFLPVTAGVTLTLDEGFAVPVAISSEGSITLSATSQPDASYFANVDFSGVQGGLLRSWLTPGVVGFNFRSANGTDVSGALATTDNWIHDNNSASGTSTSMFADGLSTLKWSSANTWACSGSTIISGYLDDGANGGNGATVTLSNVPYETYDVIVYCSSDSNPGQFLAKTVNGTTYTWDSATGAVVAGNSVWGKAALSTPVYGVNAMRIKNLSGPLTIYGGARNSSIRGGIAAIEIMPPNTPDNIRTYTLTLNGAATTWSAGTWTLNGQTVDAPASGYVEIVASASTALTVDQAVNLAELKVRGDTNIVITVSTNDTGSLYAIKATVESGVFQQGSPAVLGTTPSIVVKNGATFDENGMAVNAANAVTIAGAGAGNWPWALTSSSGAGGAILGGLYLSANATIGGVNELKIGQTGAGYYCYLNGFTLTKTGAGALTCTNMNTPGTGTIDVYGGAMSVNQWNNLNSSSGDTTLILRSGTSLANNTDRVIPVSVLKLLGGTINSGAWAVGVNNQFVGSGSMEKLVFSADASALLDGDLTVTTALTLSGNVSFSKDPATAGDVVVSAAAVYADAANFTLGDGVSLNFSTGTITCSDLSTIGANVQTLLQSDNWKGTFEISGIAAAKPLNLQNYGNTNSTIKLTSVGTDNNSYLPSGLYKVGRVVLTDDGDTPALQLNNGFSNQNMTFCELAGTGTFVQNNANIYQGLTINVMTNFTGTLSPNKMVVTFGTEQRTGSLGGAGSNPDDITYRLFVDPDAVFSVQAGFSLWGADNAELNGTMDFKVDAGYENTIRENGKLVLLDNIVAAGGTIIRGPNFAITINGAPLNKEKFAYKLRNGQLYLVESRGIAFTLK